MDYDFATGPSADWGDARLNLRRRKVRGRIFEGISIAVALVGVAAFLLILGYIVYRGIGSVNLDLFTQTPKPVGESGGGMANAIAGTALIVGIASAIALPVGILCGTYLAEFGQSRFGMIVRTVADVLTGVPSIIIGIIAYQLVVIPMKQFSALAGGIALAILMIPTIVRTTEEILRLVPRQYMEAALALGAPRWRATVSIIYPAAMSGMTTGVMLAISRAAGETAPLLFTAFGNTFWNWNVMQPTAALPLQIYQYAISPYDDWHRQAWAAALVLVGLILILSAISRYARDRKPR